MRGAKILLVHKEEPRKTHAHARFSNQPINEASSACSFAYSFLLMILTPPLRVVRMRFC